MNSLHVYVSQEMLQDVQKILQIQTHDEDTDQTIWKETWRDAHLQEKQKQRISIRPI